MRTTALEYLNRKRRERVFIANTHARYGALVLAVLLLSMIAATLAGDYLEIPDKYVLVYVIACFGAICWFLGYVSGRGRE